MQNELCIGEYEMHIDCKGCQIKDACKKKYKKLMNKYKEYLQRELPKRSQAKDYIELQKMEAERQYIKDQMKKIRAKEVELREIKYNKTLRMNQFFGLENEEKDNKDTK